MDIQPTGLIRYLIRSDLDWLGRTLLKVLRLKWHDRPIQTEHGSEETTLPTGSFVTTRKKQSGDLLLWVPHRIDSYLIVDLTGDFVVQTLTTDLIIGLHANQPHADSQRGSKTIE